MSIKIPFYQETGSLVDYPMGYREYDWKDNFEFEATLVIYNMSRGRSAANFTLKDDNDRTYNMFMTDTLNMMKNGIVNKGVISGKWTFCKRGSNYGIKFIGEREKQ